MNSPVRFRSDRSYALWVRMIPAVAALTLAVADFPRQPAAAAEFQLRAQCPSRGALVTLGEVAEIFSADRQQADRLAAIELFPAPPAGQQRFVRLREIQDLLLLRGVNLAEHRFSGSSQVVVVGAGEPGLPEREKPLPAAEAKKATRQVHETVLQYLRQNGSGGDAWKVEFQLNDSQARCVAKADQRISISGGAAPWTGMQRFEVTVDSPDGPAKFPLEVQITRPAAVVVTARALSRGAVIRPDDVQLARNVPQAEQGDAFRSLEEVVGREVLRAIPEGRVLERSAVRSPLMVRRGEVVTVYALSAGIRIRTMARSRDDGSLGDLIALESLVDRKTYFARVSGVQEAEVYARAVEAAQPAPSGDSPIVRR